MAVGWVLHPVACPRGQLLGYLLEGSLADQFNDLIHMQVVAKAVAGDKKCITTVKRERCTDFDMHVGRPDQIGYQMPILVIHGLAFVEHAAFHRVADR